MQVQLNTYVDADAVGDGGWDVIILATGGIPATPDVPGGQLVLDSWDVLSGSRRVTGHVMVYDDHGGNQALDVAEAIARSGATVEIVTPERTVSPDVGGLVASQYFTSLAEQGIAITVLRRLLSVERNAGQLSVSLGIDGSEWRENRTFDSVVAECGTEPNSELYDLLVAGSSNHGEINIDDLMALREQTSRRNPEGTYQLFRIGDAVSSRNVHAGMLDAARLCRAI